MKLKFKRIKFATKFIFLIVLHVLLAGGDINILLLHACLSLVVVQGINLK